MNLELTKEQAVELKALLESSLADLSYEIAATDNGAYRSGIELRRGMLKAILDGVMRISATDDVHLPPPAVFQEFSHPGG